MIPTRPSGRKRWNLHDGPRGSLRRLRSQLAEDGCVESQVQLAKQLLEERCDLEADRLSNIQQAMEWLICATEQGHKEARSMLGRCVQNEVLSSQTAVMVRARSCLTASQQETVARKAARDLFASLSNGEEYITSAQLEKRMREIWNLRRARDDDSSSSNEEPPLEDKAEEEGPEDGQREEDLGENALEPSNHLCSGEYENGFAGGDQLQQEYQPSVEDAHIRNITEDNLVSAAINYCHGQLPIVSRELTLTDPNVRALDQIPYLHRAFLHPIVFFQIIYIKLLSYFSGLSYQLTNLQILFLFFIHSICGTENIVLFFPLIFYYLSFVLMIVNTFKMLHTKREFIDFRKWSGLFLRYSEGNLDSEESEQQFVKKNLKPFIHFFLSLLVHLSFYPIVAAHWIPLSEFTVMAFCLTFFTLFSFSTNNSYSRFPDWLSFLSFGINVLAKYPYEHDAVVNQGWRFLDLQIQTFPSYIVGNGVEFCLNSRVLFYLMIPGIILMMARRERWHGSYKYAIPHCVVLSWLQIFIINSQGATMYGLMRGTLALVGMFLFLPIMGVTTIFLPVFAVVKLITLSNVMYVASLTGGVLVTLLITCLLAKNKTMKKYITPLQIFAAFITLIFLFSPQIKKFHFDNIEHKEALDLISDEKLEEADRYVKFGGNAFLDDTEAESFHLLWDEYQTFCHSASWEKTNIAETQIKCTLLDGVKVNWHGYVVDVRLLNVENTWSNFAEKLPGFLGDFVKCYYGEKYEFDCEKERGEALRECRFLENIVQKEGKKCHLNNLDRYEHEITVRMESGLLLKKGAEITLKASHHFTNFSRKIKVNDKIRFRGILDSRTFTSPKCGGLPRPTLNVYELSCIGCQNYELKDVKLPIVQTKKYKFTTLYKSLVNDIYISMKYILNFVLNPIVTFK